MFGAEILPLSCVLTTWSPASTTILETFDGWNITTRSGTEGVGL